jgi:hypothetical protein
MAVALGSPLQGVRRICGNALSIKVFVRDSDSGEKFVKLDGIGKRKRPPSERWRTSIVA